MNSRLAAVITSAKKIGFPKASIDNAIARGQGVSANGAALESVTIEAIMPPSVALIIECQTDSKPRTLNDMRLAIKEAGGTMTPTTHLFDRKGKIIVENPDGMGEDDIFDRAIEAGAVDIELENDGSVVIFTESTETTAVAKALSESSSLRVTHSDIIWDPKEDMMVDVSTPDALNSFLGRQIRASKLLKLLTC
jgi:transcriptional/translational regulatory protein YebC/TACO1